MSSRPGRRHFLGATAAAAAIGFSDTGFLGRLSSVSAAEAKLAPDAVKFGGDIEPLVKLIEDTPRERVLEEVGDRVRKGLAYKELLAALLLAGVRNIQPRPVGFKFHAVLVVNSAHIASLASPAEHRWLPIFWAIDAFKASAARDVQEGDWTMRAVEEKSVPSAEKAGDAFAKAMENWDEGASDVAAAALARTAKKEDIFELFARFGMRDFRDIGHKAIYVANSWRTLAHIGWGHAEPVLRSLAYALLMHEGENPARRDAAADRDWRENQERVSKIREGWSEGKRNDAAALDLLETMRSGSSADASAKVVELLNRNVAPASIWAALFDGAGELMMRDPNIRSLHAVTTTNAMHFAFNESKDDRNRRLLLLQNAAFIPLFRGAVKEKGAKIDEVAPLDVVGKEAVAEILADVSRDKMTAARKTLAYAKANPEAKELIDAARLLVFFKGRDSHDYKYSSAVLEDYAALSSPRRERYLAASMFYLKGSGAKDNELVRRIRAAVG